MNLKDYPDFKQALLSAPAVIPDWFNPGIERIPDLRFDVPDKLPFWKDLDKEAQNAIHRMLENLPKVHPNEFLQPDMAYLGDYLHELGKIDFLKKSVFSGAKELLNNYHKQCINVHIKMTHFMSLYGVRRFYLWRLYYAYTTCKSFGMEIPKDLDMGRLTPKYLIDCSLDIAIPTFIDPGTVNQYVPDIEKPDNVKLAPCDVTLQELEKAFAL